MPETFLDKINPRGPVSQKDRKVLERQSSYSEMPRRFEDVSFVIIDFNCLHLRTERWRVTFVSHTVTTLITIVVATFYLLSSSALFDQRLEEFLNSASNATLTHQQRIAVTSALTNRLTLIQGMISFQHFYQAYRILIHG